MQTLIKMGSLVTPQWVEDYVSEHGTSGAALEYKGGYSASDNVPDLNISPFGINKGDMYTVTSPGTFFTTLVEVGDALIAEKDNPTLESEWTILNKNISTASDVSITDVGEYFEGTEIETALQEAGQYITDLTDDTTLVNTISTPSVSGGVFTITLTQPDGLNLEFNIDSTHLSHNSDTMTLDITSFAGTDAVPKTIYVYVINIAGSPVLTASNTSPGGVVEHVHIGNVKVGTVGASSATVYGGFSSPVNSYEIAAHVWHRFFTNGARYYSGMEITATSSNVIVGAGRMDIVFDRLSTVEKAVGTDGLFVISNAGAYTTQTDFAFTEYSTGETISSNKPYNVIIGYVWSSAGSGKLMGLVQKGDMIPSGKEYRNVKEATEDKYGTLVLSPSDDLLKQLFTPVCRVVVLNDGLQELPEGGTGIYAIDLRGNKGGGSGSVATASNTDAGTADNDSLYWNNTLGVYEPKTPTEARAILNVEDGATADQDLSLYQLQPSEGPFVNGDKTKLDNIVNMIDGGEL